MVITRDYLCLFIVVHHQLRLFDYYSYSRYFDPVKHQPSSSKSINIIRQTARLCLSIGAIGLLPS
jgi:hypothetical protein